MHEGDHSPKQWFIRHRFTALLISLFALIAVSPAMDRLQLGARGFPLGDVLVDTILLVTLLAGISAAGKLRQPRAALFLLAVPLVATLCASYFKVQAAFVVIMHLGAIGFFALTTFWILRHVLRGGRVSIEEINAAVSVYLMTGIAFAYVHSLIEFLAPGSFGGAPLTMREIAPDTTALSHRESFPGFLYYSFASLTTLGFGDIVPVKPEARIISVLETVCGQVYLAVLIARLVGLHITHAASGHHHNP